jgi:hypothetical protein
MSRDRAHPQNRVHEAAVVSATNAAKEAERCGGAAAARHRKSAAQDHDMARRTRHEAAVARQSIETLRLP